MFRSCCLALAIVGLLLSSSAFAQRDRSPAATDANTRSAATVASLQKNLKDARRLLVEIDDKRLRERLELLLSRASLQAEDLEESLEGVPRQRPARPIDEAELEKLLKNVKEQAFDEQKVDFIVTFVKQRPISCEQATQILKLIAFDEGRSKAAIALYPSVVDVQNFYEVLKIFPFDSSRKAVMEAIKKQNK
jgi:hypothetical protein